MINMMPLKRVCSDIIDCPHESPEWLSAGIPVIRNFNLVDGQIDLSEAYYVDEKTYIKRTRRATPSGGDIIFSREAPIGNCAIVPQGFKCCLGQRLVLLRVNREICSPEYLLAALLSDFVKMQILQVEKSGSIVSNFNIGDLEDLVIPVIDSQETVASISDLLNKKLLLNRNASAALESMAKTLYDYWFTQFDFPNAEGKPYRSSGGAMEWNDQLKREIPKGWKVETVEKTCSIIDCLHSQKPELSYEGEDRYLLQLDNLIDLGLISLDSKYYVTQKMYDLWTSRIQVKDGDLVVTNAGRVGAVSRIPQHVTAGIGRNMTAIRPQRIPAFFLYYFFKSPDFAVQMRANTDSGSFFGSLNVRGIKRLLLTLPPKNTELLIQFDLVVEPMRRKIENLQLENEELSKLRDWLLPMLMNGQATVR